MTFFANNRTQTILDIFTFDLSTFFLNDDYIEIRSEDEQGTIMIDYEKALPWTELNLFDVIIYRMFVDKRNLTGSNHINASLLAKNTIVDISKIQDLIEKLFKVYGNDDNNNGLWNTDDDGALKNSQVERDWTLGKDKEIYTVKLIYSSKEKVTLTIFFLNRLLKLSGKL